MTKPLKDAHRHIGRMPAYPFYGGPAITADVTAKATVAELVADLDANGIERALVLPNYGVPDPDIAFGLNHLALDAAQQHSDRIRCGLWVSPKPADKDRNAEALKLAGEHGVAVLKTSFLLGGHPADPECKPQLDQIFATAKQHGLVVHIHTSPGSASDIDQVGKLVEEYAGPDGVPVHLVHLGGGMSGHMKLIGGRLFDWIERGFQVYSDTSWTIGFAPAWLVREIEKRGIGHDRILFATDAPWGDFDGEYARLRAAAGDGDLGGAFFSENFSALYG
jgi:predicted TIM-barrel fold metal-dependent hydrolase